MENFPCSNLLFFFASCPVARLLQESSGSIFFVSSDQVHVDSSKVSHSSSLFKTEQAQFSQPVLECHVFLPRTTWCSSSGLSPVCQCSGVFCTEEPQTGHAIPALCSCALVSCQLAETGLHPLKVEGHSLHGFKIWVRTGIDCIGSRMSSSSCLSFSTSFSSLIFCLPCIHLRYLLMMRASMCTML